MIYGAIQKSIPTFGMKNLVATKCLGVGGALAARRTWRDLRRTFLTKIDSYLPAEMYCSTRATEAALFATRLAIANLHPAVTR